MSLAIGDDHEFLAGAVARFATQRCGPEVARAAAEGPADALPPFWAELDELGWLTLDREGGLGFSELVVVLEGLGQQRAGGRRLGRAHRSAGRAIHRGGQAEPLQRGVQLRRQARGFDDRGDLARLRDHPTLPGWEEG